VTASHPRAPAPDRKQRHIERAGESPHSVEQIGVTGEEDPLRTFDKVAKRFAGARKRVAAPIVREQSGGYFR
jgi:hypothetical protein